MGENTWLLLSRGLISPGTRRRIKDAHKQLQIPEKNKNGKSKISTSHGNRRRLCGRSGIWSQTYREIDESLIKWKGKMKRRGEGIPGRENGKSQGAEVCVCQEQEDVFG
jgi:hypothetical protein